MPRAGATAIKLQIQPRGSSRNIFRRTADSAKIWAYLINMEPKGKTK
jgi:hypothetical protein